MPAADHLRAPLPAAAISRGATMSIKTAASISRGLLRIRRNQIGHTDSPSNNDEVVVNDLDSFQTHVADIFRDLAASTDDELLSIAWLQKLLDAFLLFLEEFRVILFNHRNVAGKPPVDRMITEFCDRAVRALDVCNAVRDGIDQLRRCRRHLDIIPSAISSSSSAFGEGQLRRARRALTDLALLLVIEEKEFGPGLTHRNRSFGRNRGSSGGHRRSVSWSVSRNWSAGKQIHAIGANITTPKGGEAGGLSGVVYTMNAVLLFTMWALVAALPCQDRKSGVSAAAHFAVPKSFAWASSMMAVQERIVEESKKKERKNSIGLLREMDRVEKCNGRLLELIDAGAGSGVVVEGVPAKVAEAEENELRWRAAEIGQIGEGMKEGLDVLEQLVRDVFVTIARSRADGFDCVAINGHHSSSVVEE